LGVGQFDGKQGNEVVLRVKNRHLRYRLTTLMSLGAFLSLVSCMRGGTDISSGEAYAVQHGCFGCHGVGGVNENPNFPNLAGQKKAYIVNQLFVFKQGTMSNPKIARIAARYNGMMAAKASQLTDQEILSLADYFSTRTCSFGPKRARPAQVPRQTVICEDCHGEDGISLAPNIPNLAGQKQAYLVAQLNAFRRSSTGTNTNGASRHNIFMTRQAAKLGDKEIDELSRFYAQLDCRGDVQTNPLDQ